jgi:hypothetical protein
VVFAPDRTVVGRAAPGADVAAVEVDEGGLLTAGGEGCGLLTAGQLAAVRAAAAPSSPPPPAPPPAPENVAAGGLSLPPMGAAPSR